MFNHYDITIFFKDGSWLTVYFVLAKGHQDGIQQVKGVALSEEKEIDCYSFRKS